MKQDGALEILTTGANVFLTGEPGSGKTHTINRYVAWLREHCVEPSITASTGVAATHVGGMTIHSWSGIGVRDKLDAYELDRIAQNERVVKRIRNTSTLIIDEVSMLSATTLSMVDAVCRAVRNDQRAFGGLQVILVGDFFQLPPVQRGDRTSQGDMFENSTSRSQFAFASPAWRAFNPIVCYLSEQHRQEDADFLTILSAVRNGEVSQTHRATLLTRRAVLSHDMTHLYSHNADVDRINDAALARIASVAHVFAMTSQGSQALVESLRRGCLSPETLTLKIGARVMFTKNDLNYRYVNGTTGTVIGFAKENGYPVVKTKAGRELLAEPVEWTMQDGGRVLAKITQVPLRLAWAITVHKSQGMSLDSAHMDLSTAFEYGQGYVAISRVRTLAGLSLAGINDRALQVHPEIREKDAGFRQASQAAEEAFTKMPHEEKKKLQENFIRASGGKIKVELPKHYTTSENKDMLYPNGFSNRRISTYEATRELVLQRMSLKDMAKQRGMTLGTIINHLEKLAEEKKIDPMRDLAHIERDPDRFEEMKTALEKVYKQEGKMPLSPARAILGDAYGYDELRLARLFLNHS